MTDLSLLPILDVEVPDLAVAAWIEVVRRAVTRSGEIATQRLNMPEINTNWQRLHCFEYHHFYSAWVGVAFRFKACTIHQQNFVEVFERTAGRSQDAGLYEEDDALFGFFVKGLSALESFYYSLYALGALISTPTQTPSVPPPAQFPLLDPARPDSLRNIDPARTHRAFTQMFPGLPLTECLGHILEDTTYRELRLWRNVLAHRAPTAGRTIQNADPFFSRPPLAVMPWATDLPLDATTTTSRYTWLRETLNAALEEVAAFAAQQLPYTEDELARWVPLPTV